MEVYVIRHTKVDIPTGYCYGQTDISPLETYRDELATVKSRIPKDIDTIISSPLKRCILIATEFASDHSTDNRLLEMHFGDWEMKKWDDIPKEQLQNWMNDIVQTSAPKGENLSIVQQRVSSFLDELRTMPYQKVLIVTHAGPIRCIWNYILCTPLANTFKIPIDYGEVLHFNLGTVAQDDFILKKA